MWQVTQSKKCCVVQVDEYFAPQKIVAASLLSALFAQFGTFGAICHMWASTFRSLFARRASARLGELSISVTNELFLPHVWMKNGPTCAGQDWHYRHEMNLTYSNVGKTQLKPTAVPRVVLSVKAILCIQPCWLLEASYCTFHTRPTRGVSLEESPQLLYLQPHRLIELNCIGNLSFIGLLNLWSSNCLLWG